MKTQPPPKTLQYAIPVGIVLVLGGLALSQWLPSPDSPSFKDVISTSEKTNQPATIAQAREQVRNDSGLNQSGFESSETSAGQASQLPDANRLFEALADIRITANGEAAVLDNKALEQLQTYFDSSSELMTEDQIIVLQALIREGLPDPLGDNVARVVGNYNRYLQVRNALTPSPEADLQASTDYYLTLKQVRREIMGTETADKLFQKEEAAAEFMFAARAVEADDSLSNEQKQQKIQALDRQRLEASISVPNWSERYAQYQLERQQLMSAGLAPTDKQRQLQALIQRHFNPDEVEELRLEGVLNSETRQR